MIFSFDIYEIVSQIPITLQVWKTLDFTHFLAVLLTNFGWFCGNTFVETGKGTLKAP